MKAKLKAFIHDEDGATAVEYGVLVAGISLAIIGTVFNLGNQLNSVFGKVSSQLSTKTG